MKKTAQTNGRLIITPPANPHWTDADYAHETEVLRLAVWSSVRKLLADEWPGFSAAFTADDIQLCGYCRSEFESLTADEAADASTYQDEHSVEGEPVCCNQAIDELCAARDIPAVQWDVTP
ncbi:hypothetical protein C5F59_027725 [Streptomyces sp. QL37]|uniref:hypothetical protein n=1 Tax=Streptomyces sp. QL37 TaxID=2093747 RepID=UPI000CF1DB8D|nr:hypothetical protein [Streptomyces sp. QL37]PPQ57102.1 hypothetical protein C5F59_10725 [Streptomyces sp. QL37]